MLVNLGVESVLTKPLKMLVDFVVISMFTGLWTKRMHLTQPWSLRKCLLGLGFRKKLLLYEWFHSLGWVQRWLGV